MLASHCFNNSYSSAFCVLTRSFSSCLDPKATPTNRQLRSPGVTQVLLFLSGIPRPFPNDLLLRRRFHRRTLLSFQSLSPRAILLLVFIRAHCKERRRTSEIESDQTNKRGFLFLTFLKEMNVLRYREQRLLDVHHIRHFRNKQRDVPICSRLSDSTTMQLSPSHSAKRAPQADECSLPATDLADN